MNSRSIKMISGRIPNWRRSGNIASSKRSYRISNERI